jgi:protein-L-isoaspartate(D-aspartate) O-methyltransferase
LCDGADVTDQSFETMRHAMVASQLRPNAVNDPRVVAAMAAVERERFVPADRVPIAYTDIIVPLGGVQLRQQAAC